MPPGPALTSLGFADDPIGHRAVMAPPTVDEDGEVWIDFATAALLLGFSAQYLGRLAIAERVPGRRERPDSYTAHWWFRRRDIEQLAAARTAMSVHRDSVNA